MKTIMSFILLWAFLSFTYAQEEETEKIKKDELPMPADESEYFESSTHLSAENTEQLTASATTSSSDNATAAPGISTFSTNPDQLGALANSVNLFSGDVALPLNLVSLPGRNGLDVNLSISYSSAGISKSVGTWNLEAPTGILGLGWAMDYPKIIVDHKNTGAREDDDFYLVEGGVTNQLICIDNTGGLTRKYKTKNYQFWTIEYHHPYDIFEPEKWVITKENGVKYIYGDYENHPTAVQHLIKWGNWIGSSSLTKKQSSQVMVWNLSRVVDTWGNEVVYEYDNVEREIGNGSGQSGTQSHTEASYLKKITDSFGRTITFAYGDKRSFEYMEPHIEAGQESAGAHPDAYQERYETRYLSSIEVRNKENRLLSKTKFGYEPSKFINAGTNREKRVLGSITQENGNGDSLPNIKFTYQSSGNKGALSTVTTPAGATFTYHYERQTIGRSKRELRIEAPEGYSRPKVWNADDYVVVVWKKGDSRKIFVYEWTGEWVGGIVETIDDVSEYKVSVQKDFFTLLKDTRLFIFEKSEKERGKWRKEVEKDYGGLSGRLITGSDFVGVSYFKIIDDPPWSLLVDFSKGYTKKEGWEENIDLTHQQIHGAHNYFFVHHSNSDPDEMSIHYLDELKNWQTNEKINMGIDIGSSDRWYVNNNFAFMLSDELYEYIWRWGNTYSSLYHSDPILGWKKDDRVIYNGNAMIGIVYKYHSSFADAIRFTGKDWILEDMEPDSYSPYSSVNFGNDFVIKKNNYRGNGAYDWRLYQFNPNTLSWNNSPLTSSLDDPNSFAGQNYYIFGEKIYHKGPGGFNLLSPLPNIFCNDKKFLGGTKYFKYDHWSGSCSSATYDNTQLYLFRNGKIINSGTPVYVYPSEKSNLCQANTFVAHNQLYLNSGSNPSDILYLHRVINDGVKGSQTQYAVNRVDINDGYETRYTSYDYFPAYATMDPGGTVAQYNKVRVRPGTSSGSETVHPYGYTDTYFFNGLPYGQTASAYPETDAFTNAREHYTFLSGLPYKTEVYDKERRLQSNAVNYWYVFDKKLGPAVSYYARLLKNEKMQDGLTAVSESVFNDFNGLVKESKSYNHNSKNEAEMLKREYIYASEKYAELNNKNILTPVIQTKTFTNNTCTGVSATTWTNALGGIWAPHKFYIYTAAGEADFTNWTSGTPGANWLKTSEVVKRNHFGNVLETMDADGIHSVTKYGFNSAVPVATISNAADSESFVELCQEYRNTSDGKLAVGFHKYLYGGGGSVAFSEYEEQYRGWVQKVEANATSGYCGVYVRLGNLNERKNYIIELDIKVSSGTVQLLTKTNGAGYRSMDVLSSGGWTHKSYLWDVKNDGANSLLWIRSYRTSAVFYIDNIRIYPENAFASSANYHPVHFDVVCATNASGVNTFYEYDAFRRPVRVRNHNGAPLSETNYFLSREKYASFNTAYPNFIQTKTPALNAETRTYTDGAGKTRQSQTKVSASETMITETMYDNLGRGHIVTKPTKLPYGFGYRASFITYLMDDGKMYGEVKNYNNDYYPYSQTRFENSPLGRTLESGLPGAEFGIGRHSTKVSYLGNSDDFDDPKSFDGFDGMKYPVVETTNPDGGKSIIMRDKLGNLIGEKSGPVSGRKWVIKSIRVNKRIPNMSFTPNVTKTAQYYYDDSGQEGGFTIGTAPGRADIVNLYQSGSGTFTAQAGVTYYVFLGDIPFYNDAEAGVMAVPDPYGGVRYKTLEGSGNTYPTTTYKYDDYGNLTHIYPPNYHTPPTGMKAEDYIVEMTYDPLGRVKTQYSKDAGEVKYIYDKTGKTRFIMDANGRNASPDNILYWKYDALGRTIEEGYFSQNWNENDLQTDAEMASYPSAPNTWRKKYVYGGADNPLHYGKLVRVEVNNDAHSDAEVVEAYRYDIDGNVKDKITRIVDYKNIEKTIAYEHDILGNVTKVSYMKIDLTLENETITGSKYYEAAGKITAGNNYTVYHGASLTLKAGVSITLGTGFSVKTGGTLTTLIGGGATKPEEMQVTYAYDEAGRVHKIGTPADPDFFAAYTYGVNGALGQEKLHDNAITRTYTYEKPGWLKQINDPYFRETLSYTSGGYGGAGYYNGNIAKAYYDLKWSGNPGDYYVRYKYDKLNRLLTADNSLSGKDVGVGNEISYDANGNLLDLARNSGTNNYRYYSGTNKVQNTDGGGNDYQYDSNGNMVKSVNKNITNIAYDPAVNLAVEISAGDKTAFGYGAGNQRVLKESGDIETAYIHGLSDFPLMEKVDYGGGELTKLYVYGPTGLLAVNDNGGWFFLLKDHLGSTRVVLNENNNVVSSYDYMPYGGIMRSRVNTDIAYQFTGQEYDTELGLHNFRARLYDSDLAMFYAMDPAGQTYSPFAYSGNNPVIYVDPDGEFFIIDDFFYGFIRGIVEGKNPFKEGWESASNSYEIWSTMFRGNFGQILGKWTWELPNQLIGIFVGHVPNITGDINSVTHRDGATLIEHKAKNWGAFTIGSVITAEKDTDVNSGLFMHEYGHYIQSQRWGPLYVPVIGIPSLMSASGMFGGEHHDFYAERWANENALDHFGGKYREYYDRIYDDDPWNDYYKNLRKINKKETYSVVNRDNLQLSKKKINKLYIKFKSKKYNKTNSKRRLYDF